VTELDSAVKSTGNAIFSPLGDTVPLHVAPLDGSGELVPL
jgi:hypothetical protein